MKLPGFLGGLFLALLIGVTHAEAGDDDFRPLFNGKDLAGWDGDPALWNVEEGCITGKTQGPGTLTGNQFLVWRGGVLKNFELRAKIRMTGNNTGIQYRSRELPEIGKWSIGGYQCDIHPTLKNNGMIYDERARGILTQNGQSVMIDPAGIKWLVAEHDPVKVDVAQWHDYTIIAQGNHLVHKLDGQLTADLLDFEEDARALEGLLAFQLHRGPAMSVQIKDVQLKELPEGGVVDFDKSPIPSDAQAIEKPASPAKAKPVSQPIGAPQATPSGKPNIVVILVDDMGFSDIGCYGSEIPTPNIDALAAGGLRFTQFYNTGRCCPTRAALITGLYSHQTGIGHMLEEDGVPGYRGRLNDQCATFAEVLKPAGYFTAMSGKWHLGQAAGVTPWSRGFDRSLNAPAGGFYQGGRPNSKLFLNGEALRNDDARLPRGWYTTDLWTTFALKFIDEAREAKKPFFLYLAHNAPHFPLQAPEAEIAKFRGKYKAGWDALRLQRHARQIEMGIVDKAWPLAPRPEAIRAWESLNEEEKDRFDNIMAVYAAVVSRMDKAIGDLTAGLKARGELDNTLILFMSDNGGNAEAGPEGRTKGDPTRTASDWFCGESWAFLENTPFRRYKHFNHEGGIATPLIAHWPAGIGSKNALRKQPAHLIDIMATCVEVAGAAPIKELNGHPVLPLEGRSLVPAFMDKPIERDALYWEHEGNAAVRVGDMKLVRSGRNSPWELYDLARDRTEQHDLAAAQSDAAAQLAAKWEAWAVRAQVKPYPAKTGGGKNAGAAQ